VGGGGGAARRGGRRRRRRRGGGRASPHRRIGPIAAAGGCRTPSPPDGKKGKGGLVAARRQWIAMIITFAEETFELRWNSVLTQVALVGLVCFCEPGLYNAITSMAGGINNPELVATSNMIVYLSFALSSLLAPALINAIGARWALTFGTFGYWIYVGSLFYYQRGTMGAWAVNAAAVAIGSCAGPLWTAQNALCLSYPPLERKGQYFSVFWIVFNFGGVVGGAISLGTNWSSTASTASGSTFLAFVVLMWGGSALAMTLAAPKDVVRPDGSKVVIQQLPDFLAEARATFKLFTHREMLLLTPLFAYTGWFYPYQFGVFNAGIFNARTQGLNNMFYWGAQMLGAQWIGKYLDTVPEGGGRGASANCRGACVSTC
jgi:MFS family permease